MKSQIIQKKSLISKIDFGNDAGDDVTPEEILTFFVEQDDFSKFLDYNNRILLATAKKGVGKSALIKWIVAKKSEEIIKTGGIVISVNGSDLVRSNFKTQYSPKLPNEYIRDWMIRICAVINRQIGKTIKFAKNDDEIFLVENAELDGFKDKNILSALTSRFINIFQKLNTNKEMISSEIEILKRFEGKNIWFCVDDLDATYQRTDKENLELATFFTACRYLCSQNTGIYFRATMRTDVWTMIRRYDESLDKFTQYVQDITWSQSDFRKLLAKRIESQIKLISGVTIIHHKEKLDEENDEYIIDKIFEKRVVWSGSERRTYQVLHTLSYHRPRWAIQLCKLTQEEAIRGNDEKINKSHIDAVWGEYGNRRIADLVAEHKHQCSKIEELVVAFRGAERRMTTANLILWIKNHITEHMSASIEGEVINEPKKIAHFLFRLGFIVARIEDEDDQFEHYYFSDYPDLLSTRTNNDFGAIWEIHPCYREALEIKKMNKRRKHQRNLAR